MEISITTMSKNGQVVIPSDVREDAGIGPATKFLVFNDGKNIMLKAITKDELLSDMKLLESIEHSERQIRQGDVVKADTAMSDDEMDRRLMAD